MTGSYLRGVPLGPIGRQKVDTTTISLAGFLLKVLSEFTGAVDLEARPGCSQNVGDSHGTNVGDRLVQECDNRHAHHPDLEGHKGDVFALVVVNSAQA